jgi:putative nucleotidyltransferase with HDIG domain
MWFLKKTSPRRSRLRRTISAERLSQVSQLVTGDYLISVLILLLFVILAVPVLSFELIQRASYLELLPITVLVVLITLATAFYIYHYQGRIIRNHARALALVGLFILLLAATKLGSLLADHDAWATATAVTAAIILTIAYNQRFAVGMGIFYCIFAYFAAGPKMDASLFLTMVAGAITCCFALREIRTRMRLLEVGALAAVIVFLTSLSLFFLARSKTNFFVFTIPPEVPSQFIRDALRDAGYHAGATIVVCVLIQGLLPLIEKIFRIATSMTLLDYSDANQPLLKRLAMEAPGTFSHSLLVGSISEAAAETIGRNGLLCRVGAYYHDIGKMNKPGYFVENEMGSLSRHNELSPAMSQLIIVGHVKDGAEMAKEYALPAVLRQFIETHHGTTLIEYFYNQAKKLTTQDSKQKTADAPSETEFRYAGPKPRTKEAGIVMLADAVESAIRSLTEVTPTRIEAVVHNIAMKRLQDGQFDECDLSLRELSQIEASMSKNLAAHYHSRIAYPKQPDLPQEMQSPQEQTQPKKVDNHGKSKKD